MARCCCSSSAFASPKPNPKRTRSAKKPSAEPVRDLPFTNHECGELSLSARVCCFCFSSTVHYTFTKSVWLSILLLGTYSYRDLSGVAEARGVAAEADEESSSTSSAAAAARGLWKRRRRKELGDALGRRLTLPSPRPSFWSTRHLLAHIFECVARAHSNADQSGADTFQLRGSLEFKLLSGCSHCASEWLDDWRSDKWRLMSDEWWLCSTPRAGILHREELDVRCEQILSLKYGTRCRFSPFQRRLKAQRIDRALITFRLKYIRVHITCIAKLNRTLLKFIHFRIVQN